jgi:hypothetical protein
MPPLIKEPPASSTVQAAIGWSWFILSMTAGGLATSPFLFGSSIYGVAPTCVMKAQTGLSCSLCGMTTAFVHLADLDFQAALAAHRFSVHLWLLFVLNAGAAVIWAARQYLKKDLNIHASD